MAKYPTVNAFRAVINFLTWLIDADTTQKITDIKTHYPKLTPVFNLVDRLKAKITSSKIVRAPKRFLFWFMKKDITETRRKIDPKTHTPALTPALALLVLMVYLLFFGWLFVAIKAS